MIEYISYSMNLKSCFLFINVSEYSIFFFVLKQFGGVI